MPTAIDLNADLGEGVGDDDAMLSIVTSANVACGGHAGDRETMVNTLSAAARRGVTVGAHPSFNDREGFGRRAVSATYPEIQKAVVAQVAELLDAATATSARVRYIKLHGALANQAASDTTLASVVVDAIGNLKDDLSLLVISGSALETVGREAGLSTFAEVFADRGYSPNGLLVPRGEPGAMIDNPAGATARMLEFLETGLMPTVGGGSVELAADSICVHGDSAHAVAMAAAIRDGLTGAGIVVESFDTEAGR